MANNKVLILYAHPSPHRSEVNQCLFDTATSLAGITAIDLYYEYPASHINIDVEQQRLIEHDVVIFLFPLYWYSTPAILKEWQDLVLEHGFAYGHEGNALEGKTFLCALSAGGREEAYQAKGYNHYTIRELLHPLEQMATLTGMRYLAPFCLFGARTAKDERRLDTHISQWSQLLADLVDDNLDVEAACQAKVLNVYLSERHQGELE